MKLWRQLTTTGICASKAGRYLGSIARSEESDVTCEAEADGGKAPRTVPRFGWGLRPGLGGYYSIWTPLSFDEARLATITDLHTQNEADALRQMHRDEFAEFVLSYGNHLRNIDGNASLGSLVFGAYDMVARGILRRYWMFGALLNVEHSDTRFPAWHLARLSVRRTHELCCALTGKENPSVPHLAKALQAADTACIMTCSQ